MDDVAHIVEIRGLYDGWAYAVLKDGTAENRFGPGDYRYERTQAEVEAYNSGRDSHADG